MAKPKSDLLELETRRIIYRHVENNPGIHLRELERVLGLALSTLEYHLHQMERHGVLSSRAHGRMRGYFVAEGMDRRDKDLLYLIRRRTPRKVLTLLLMDPGLTPGELAQALNLSPSTLTSHLKRLVKHGAVEVERAGRAKMLRVTEPERATRLLVSYRESFVDNLVDRFVATFEGARPAAGTSAPGQGEEPGAAEAAAVEKEEAEPEEPKRSEKPSETRRGHPGALRRLGALLDRLLVPSGIRGGL